MQHYVVNPVEVFGHEQALAHLAQRKNNYPRPLPPSVSCLPRFVISIGLMRIRILRWLSILMPNLSRILFPDQS
jgi:hypothetical protein